MRNLHARAAAAWQAAARDVVGDWLGVRSAVRIERAVLENVDELVLVAAPAPLARPVARRHVHQVDAEITEPARIAETLADAAGAQRVERAG